MKKLLFIALFLTYGFSSSGITLQFHFCCGKFKGVSWSPAAGHGCNQQLVQDERPCCETKYFSIEEDETYDKNPEFSLTIKINSAFSTFYETPGFHSLKLLSTSFSYRQPFFPPEKLFARNGNYRI